MSSILKILTGEKYLDTNSQSSLSGGRRYAALEITAGLLGYSVVELELLGTSYAVGISLLAFALVFFAFFINLKVLRLVKSTPTSKLRSAAQGFSEFTGRVIGLDKELKTPVSGTPCAWYYYEQQEYVRSGKSSRWTTTYAEFCNRPILLTDDQEHYALVYPQSLSTKNLTNLREFKSTLDGVNIRHNEYVLKDNEEVYIHGEFKTLPYLSDSTGRVLAGDYIEGKELQKFISEVYEKHQLNHEDPLNIIVFDKSKEAGLLSKGDEDDLIDFLQKGLFLSGLLWTIGLSFFLLNVYLFLA